MKFPIVQHDPFSSYEDGVRVPSDNVLERCTLVGLYDLVRLPSHTQSGALDCQTRHEKAIDELGERHVVADPATGLLRGRWQESVRTAMIYEAAELTGQEAITKRQ